MVSVIDEDPDGSEMVLDLPNQVCNLCSVEHVGLNGYGFPAPVSYRPDHLACQVVSAGVVDDDARALGCERSGDGAP